MSFLFFCLTAFNFTTYYDKKRIIYNIKVYTMYILFKGKVI